MIKARIKRSDDQGTPPKEWAAIEENLCTSIWYNRKRGRKKMLLLHINFLKNQIAFCSKFFLVGNSIIFYRSSLFSCSNLYINYILPKALQDRNFLFPPSQIPWLPYACSLPTSATVPNHPCVSCLFLYQVILIFSQATPSTLGVDPHLVQYSRLYKINVVPYIKTDVQQLKKG